MHVHLGQIETNLISAVVQGSTSLKSPFTVTCTRPKKDGKLCAAAQSGGAIKVRPGCVECDVRGQQCVFCEHNACAFRGWCRVSAGDDALARPKLATEGCCC
jgi:hypothetical protein